MTCLQFQQGHKMKYAIGFALAMPLIFIVALAAQKKAEADWFVSVKQQCKKEK